MKLYVEFFVNEVLYFLFHPRLPVTKSVQEAFAPDYLRDNGGVRYRHEVVMEQPMISTGEPQASSPFRGRRPTVGGVLRVLPVSEDSKTGPDL